MKTTVLSQFIENILESNVSSARYGKLNPELWHNYSTSFVFDITTGGARGGHWDGSSASSYRVDSEDRRAELKEFLESYYLNILKEDGLDQKLISKIAEEFAEKYYDNGEINNYSDYSDYYGNGREYSTVAVPILEFMEALLEKSDYQAFNGIFLEKSEECRQLLQMQASKIELEKINTKIDNFNNAKDKEYTQLTSTLEQTKKQVINIEKNLLHFEKTKQKEYSQLITIKQNLEKTLSPDEQVKPKVKK